MCYTHLNLQFTKLSLAVSAQFTDQIPFLLCKKYAYIHVERYKSNFVHRCIYFSMDNAVSQTEVYTI